jgi:ADP-ribose pyrophosphatase YjhB (NUDIX family)
MIDKTWYQKPKSKINHRMTSGGVVVRKDNDVIYVSLIIEGRFKDYSLPKGGVKTGEEILDAARREIFEESGISDLDLIEYLGKRERLNITKTKWNTMHYFLFMTKQKKVNSLNDSERHGAKWFRVDALPKMVWPEQKRLIQKNRDKIEKYFLS